MRESLFGSLGDRVTDARFADLYAGCGSVGIEALSRGAGLCVFVEKDARCMAALTENLARAHLAERAVTVRGPVERAWRRVWEAHGPFDIVFADPPYGLESFAGVAQRLVADKEGIAPGGLVVLQCRAGEDLPGLPACVRARRFGETELRYYEA